MSGSGLGGLGGLIVVLSIAWGVLIVWLVVVWLRVGIRWLRLHPAPPEAVWRGQPALPPPAAFEAAAAATPAAPPSVAPERRDALAAWAAGGEGPAATGRRLGVSSAAAAQVRLIAFKAAAGNASPDEWAQLEPWLPKLLAD